MDDIVPGLLEKIESDFADGLARNQQISKLLELAEAGSATHFQSGEYARLVGVESSEALRKSLTEDVLPDGKLYYNIAERTIRPTVEKSHNLVNTFAGAVQKTMNAAVGIGIQAILPELDDARLQRLISKAADGDQFVDVAWLIDSPIITLTQSFADDFVRANVEFQNASGLNPTVRRTMVGKCCDWCASLAGEYDADTIHEDVFRRHRYCNCIVTSVVGRFQQDVHSKRWYNQDGNALNQRRLIGLDVTQLTAEEAAAREKLLDKMSKRRYREHVDSMILRYQQENDVSHRRAANRVGRMLKENER